MYELNEINSTGFQLYLLRPTGRMEVGRSSLLVYDVWRHLQRGAEIARHTREESYPTAVQTFARKTAASPTTQPRSNPNPGGFQRQRPSKYNSCRWTSCSPCLQRHVPPSLPRRCCTGVVRAQISPWPWVRKPNLWAFERDGRGFCFAHIHKRSWFCQMVGMGDEVKHSTGSRGRRRVTERAGRC